MMEIKSSMSLTIVVAVKTDVYDRDENDYDKDEGADKRPGRGNACKHANDNIAGARTAD